MDLMISTILLVNLAELLASPRLPTGTMVP